MRQGGDCAMPSTIRLAFVAALAAFALGACSGGGGKPTTTAGTMTPAPGATPAPSPSTPTAGDRTDFFPVRAEQKTISPVLVPSTGSTLENLVRPRSGTGADAVGQRGLNGEIGNFPQFSEFEFGASAENANGIALQKSPTKLATTRLADTYAAVAYQAVLEHSMFLFQGGVYNLGIELAGRFRNTVGPDALFLSIGTPSTGNPVAGRWKGTAVALEFDPDSTSATVGRTQAENLIVQGDVEIGVTLDGNDQNVTWAFRNWDGGSIEYPDVTHEGTALVTEGDFASSDHYRTYFKEGEEDPGPNGWTSRSVEIQFYGPGRQEAGGRFGFQREYGDTASDVWLQGVFAAKKDE